MRKKKSLNFNEVASHSIINHRKDFLDGFITSITNPKIALFYLLVIPQFIQPGKSITLQLLLLVFFQNIMKLISLVFYSNLANKVKLFLLKGKDIMIQYLCGAAIIAAGAFILFDNF